MNKIKAVIFDIDGVLIDSVYANAVFFERFFERYRADVKFSKTSYVKINHMTMWDVIKHYTNAESNEVKKFWLLAEDFPYPHGFVKVPKDAKRVIALLSKRFMLAIVTARRGTRIISLLKRYGYLRYIKTIVSFEDYKRPKPHPEPLRVALRKMKIKSNEAVYVGDMDADVVSANAAGVASIFFSKKKNKKADFNISTFKQLLTVLQNGRSAKM